MPNPTGRKVQAGAAIPVYLAGNDAAAIEVAVTEGEVWECIAGGANGHNVWAPGVYGWKRAS